jgi:hypothetical protein
LDGFHATSIPAFVETFVGVLSTDWHALALAEALGMRPLQAHCHLGLGTLYAKTARPEEAHAKLTTAIHLYRAIEMAFWLPQAEAALAQIGA